MNEFRERLLSGKPLRDPLLREKGGRKRAKAGAPLVSDGEEEPVDASLDGLVIPRETPRLSNHRDGDRHRLIQEEQATASWEGRDFRVEVVNLSGGGAMIEASFTPRLWDRVDLSFGGCGSLEAAVRWIKGSRIGLEFAHETRIDAEPEVRSALLREVIRRSFPEAAIETKEQPGRSSATEAAAEAPTTIAVDRGEKRHPLVWSGLVHFNHDSTPVRLRNISAAGALVDSAAGFPVGAELLLDLGEAGSIFCTVAWAHGDQTGLRFHNAFNLALLARSKPDLAPARWTKPDYLRDDSADSSPWASRWNRLTVGELRQALNR